jgi:hypothetical protein
MSDEQDIEWNEGFEMVLKKEAEQAESLFWLHNKSSILQARNNDYITIPSIVLQTLTGFLSATGGLVPSLALGAVSVFTGILSTLVSYYRFSAKAEGHRVVGQLYMKIYKHLEVELALPIAQRTDPDKLLKDVREKLQRIAEVAPDVPESVIEQYKSKFKDNKTSHPIIANGLDPVKIYKDDTGFPASPTSPNSGKNKVSISIINADGRTGHQDA